MSIRAVVFDIGGVLELAATTGDPTRAYDAFLAAWDTQLGFPAGELVRRMGQMTGDGEIGTCTEAQYNAELVTVAGIDAAHLPRFLSESWDIYLGRPNDELFTWIRRRRATHRIAMLSNSFVGAREREEERYRFSELCELIVYSHEVGVKKPDERIYRVTLDRLGLRPDEVVFVDDVAPNIEAASAIGLHTVHFQETAPALHALDALLDGE